MVDSPAFGLIPFVLFFLAVVVIGTLVVLLISLIRLFARRWNGFDDEADSPPSTLSHVANLLLLIPIGLVLAALVTFLTKLAAL